MSTPGSMLVVIAVGGILIAGTACAIFTASHGAHAAVKWTFEDESTPARQPVAEPLFPALPTQQ